ncbi:hypothetical protein CMI37_27675 [Candidatus Pacearchaeota archaeon]|nr:hypothetical protein [Candidatus Pacearchaeota archaeon]
MSHEKIIILAADHNGIERKAFIKSLLTREGFFCIDLGPHESAVSVDYVDYSEQLSIIVSNEEAPRGILICGTGVGMSIVANRFKGVRAVLAHNLMTARKSREHNDSNVLCLGAWVSSETETQEIVLNWVNESWGEGRHVKRVGKIDNYSGIVLANGVFDILHKGHIELLKFAKSQGDNLVVAIDSDERVRSIKGESRPINSEEDRKRLLEALSFVDEVLVFNSENDLRSLYSKISPSCVVKGGEWTADEVRKRDNIEESIDIKIYPIVGNYSTTNTLRKIKDLNSC